MVKRLAAGDMRHPVVIQRHKIELSSTAVDSYGQVSSSSTAWVVVARPRAMIEHLSGQEAELARQLYPNATYRLTIDYNATLDSTGGTRRTVTFGSRTMHIGAVLNPDLENRQLQLLCGEER